MSWLSKAFGQVKNFILPAAAVVAAPFTGGASLALLPQAIGAQGVLNTVFAGQDQADTQKRQEQAAQDANAQALAQNQQVVNAQVAAINAQTKAFDSQSTPVTSPAIVQAATPIYSPVDGTTVQIPRDNGQQNNLILFGGFAVLLILFLFLRKKR